jgi:hypothetical protein
MAYDCGRCGGRWCAYCASRGIGTYWRGVQRVGIITSHCDEWKPRRCASAGCGGPAESNGWCRGHQHFIPRDPEE